jgi:predicted DNA-binding protein (MmcQ/YjbR family)
MKADKKFVIDYAKEYFGTEPEYLWEKTPDAGVLRHSENKKWYGLIMNIPISKLGIKDSRNVDILNVKCDPQLLGSFLMKKGCFPAYHMNKKHWLTVLIDGSLPQEDIIMLINQSYDLTSSIK